MKNSKFIVGIDISKKKLDVSLVNTTSSKEIAYFVVSNDTKGFDSIKRKLKSLGFLLNQCLFCFEDTGIYGIKLAIFLEHKDVAFSIVPAIEIHRSKGISRGKSDKTDSKMIALYALSHHHKLKASSIPNKNITELKLMISEREKMVKVIRIIDSTQELKGFLPDEEIEDTLRVNLDTSNLLQKQLGIIELKIIQLINKCALLKEQYKLICSVPGVGPKTAVQLIATTKAFTCFSNWRKLACYAGIAPFEYSSGSSIKGRTKVHHLADKSLKCLLHMCALNMKRSDFFVRAYYDKKIKEGKNPMLVMNAIRCKVISRVFAVVKRGTPYIQTAKFAA